jgi:hypothetical protein
MGASARRNSAAEAIPHGAAGHFRTKDGLIDEILDNQLQAQHQNRKDRRTRTASEIKSKGVLVNKEFRVGDVHFNRATDAIHERDERSQFQHRQTQSQSPLRSPITRRTDQPQPPPPGTRDDKLRTRRDKGHARTYERDPITGEMYETTMSKVARRMGIEAIERAQTPDLGAFVDAGEMQDSLDIMDNQKDASMDGAGGSAVAMRASNKNSSQQTIQHMGPPRVNLFLPLGRYEHVHPLDPLKNTDPPLKYDLDLETEIDFPQWGFRIGVPFVWNGSKLRDCLLITHIYSDKDLDKEVYKEERTEMDYMFENLGIQDENGKQLIRKKKNGEIVVKDTSPKSRKSVNSRKMDFAKSLDRGMMTGVFEVSGAKDEIHPLAQWNHNTRQKTKLRLEQVRPGENVDESKLPRPVQRFARIVSVNGITKDVTRMLKVMSMATRDLKLGVVNSAFVKAYQGKDVNDKLRHGLPSEVLGMIEDHRD